MHYVRKAHEHEVNEVVKYPHTITNTELEEILVSGERVYCIRCSFAFGAFPSTSMPLGELKV